MEKETIMFRFVPTMRCNFRCEYCFLDDSQKANANTMFDNHSVDEWIVGIKNFDNYNIEPYFWGGEPFCIDGTYEFINKLTKLDNIVSGFRMDTNIYYADRIVKECPSDKIKLNCSYHMQYHTLDEIFRKVKLLRSDDMVGMVNFVASPYNLEHLKKDYGMTVIDLIEKFADIDVFLNVAGDFAYANNAEYERHEEYKKFIQQFISPDEWKWLRGEFADERLCIAGKNMFTVNYSGDFTSCISKDVYGNLFNGNLNRAPGAMPCHKRCVSIVSYAFRCDNDFSSVNSLLNYVERNKAYRNQQINKFTNFTF